MPKSDLLAGPEYAPVADRIALFYDRFPEGRIITHLTMHNEREIMFRASVYRDTRSKWPAATGWASERIGDGDINTVACLENTETSAIGRALANLGFTASKNRPSAEEMVKAVRARIPRVAEGRPMPNDQPAGERPRDAPMPAEALQDLANTATDALSLLGMARRLGMPPRRAEIIAQALNGDRHASVDRVARTLRAWVASRRQARMRTQGLRARGAE